MALSDVYIPGMLFFPFHASIRPHFYAVLRFRHFSFVVNLNRAHFVSLIADLYAWLVVFILPVNSAINPWLYTFTTPTFRAAVRDFYRRMVVDWTSAATTSVALTSRSGLGGSSSAGVVLSNNRFSRSSFRQPDYQDSSTNNAGWKESLLVFALLYFYKSMRMFQCRRGKWICPAGNWSRGFGSRIQHPVSSDHVAVSLGNQVEKWWNRLVL